MDCQPLCLLYPGSNEHMEHHSLSIIVTHWHRATPWQVSWRSCSQFSPDRNTHVTSLHTPNDCLCSLSHDPCPTRLESFQGTHRELDIEMEGHGVWVRSSWPEGTSRGCFSQPKEPSHPRASFIPTPTEAPNGSKEPDSSSSPRNCMPVLFFIIVLHLSCLQPKRAVILQGKAHHL